jgi:hypothetical protein
MLCLRSYRASPFLRWPASLTTRCGDGTFQPGAPISRQAMAAFLYRFADLA